jgi:hypothetical protein
MKKDKVSLRCGTCLFKKKSLSVGFYKSDIAVAFSFVASTNGH